MACRQLRSLKFHVTVLLCMYMAYMLGTFIFIYHPELTNLDEWRKNTRSFIALYEEGIYDKRVREDSLQSTKAQTQDEPKKRYELQKRLLLTDDMWRRSSRNRNRNSVIESIFFKPKKNNKSTRMEEENDLKRDPSGVVLLLENQTASFDDQGHNDGDGLNSKGGGVLLKYTYGIALVASPRSDVFVKVRNVGVGHCKSSIKPAELSFSVDDWATVREVSALITVPHDYYEKSKSCKHDVVHVFDSNDESYNAVAFQLSLKPRPDMLSKKGYLEEVRSAGDRFKPKGEKNDLVKVGHTVLSETEDTTYRIENETTGTKKAASKSKLSTPAAVDTSIGKITHEDMSQPRTTPTSLLIKLESYNCTKRKKLKSNAVTCVIAPRSDHKTNFYVIGADSGEKSRNISSSEPIVLITGGVHGTEPSGMLAATEIFKKWLPKKGILVIIPLINLCGARKHSRYLKCGKNDNDLKSSSPGHTTSHDDLNRDFPPDKPPKSKFAQDIWDLVSIIKPTLFLDLHEGWGFYAQLKNNPHDKLVGSTTFSKGSSIIASPNAVTLAETMVAEVNKGVKEKKHKFLVSSPPVRDGLAMHLYQSFDTMSLVQETTVRSQPLELRATQHLIMAATALRNFGVLPSTFKPSALNHATALAFLSLHKIPQAHHDSNKVVQGGSHPHQQANSGGNTEKTGHQVKIHSHQQGNSANVDKTGKRIHSGPKKEKTPAQKDKVENLIKSTSV